MQTDYLIPLQIVLDRLTSARDDAYHTLDRTPRYRFIRRAILRGIIATYRFEIEAAEKLANS